MRRNRTLTQIKCGYNKTTEMQILLHHIYEFNKGLRSLVLHTMATDEKYKTEELLSKKGITYFLQYVNNKKINVFFGKKQCVQIIKSFNKKSLTDFTNEEDFILGIMLGYDRTQQCDRYIKRRQLNLEFIELNRLVNIC